VEETTPWGLRRGVVAVLRLLARALTWGRPVDVVFYGLSALFSAYTWKFSVLEPHRAWSQIAVWGYLAAAIVAVALRSQLARAALTGLTWVATALLPLVCLASERAAGRIGRAQDEVMVIEAASLRMLQSGTPYLDRNAIAAVPAGVRMTDYLPYQPGMAIAGLPRAVAGIAWWTDARVIMALLSTLALLAALYLLGFPGRNARTETLLRALQAVTVLPLAALTLATGGDDVPVLALSLLACALCVRRRWIAAGLVIGCAAALKLTAWPVLVILGIVVFIRARRSFPSYAAAACLLPIATLLPVLMINQRAVVENVIRFPLGHGLVRSPAASPLPGHLLTAHLPDGRQLVIALLLSALVGVTVSVLHRPPSSAAAAALVSAIGLFLAILLMPATRFGYLLYPVALLAWAPLLRRADHVLHQSRAR
jgi:hypothetical protein